MNTIGRLLLQASICLPVLLTGCTWANWNSIYRNYSVRDDSPQSLAIDVKQRVIYARTFTTIGGQKRSIVCAEPSPDALSAIGVALAGNIEVAGRGSASGSYSTAESVLNIGLRTQTIQLLRDAMYRLCEAYFNSGLTMDQVWRLQIRYQDAMVSLLAIEQLTGAATPRPAIVYSAALGESAPILNGRATTKPTRSPSRHRRAS